MLVFVCASTHLASSSFRIPCFLHFSCLGFCICGFGQGFASTCRGGVYGMFSGTFVCVSGGHLGWDCAAYDVLVVQLVSALSLFFSACESYVSMEVH